MTALNGHAQFTLYETLPFARHHDAVGALSDFDATSDERMASCEGWDLAMDRLLHWRHHPGQIEDEGLTPPSSALIDHVLKRMVQWRRAAQLPPTGIAPSGDGGIALSRRDGAWLFELEFGVDGRAVFTAFAGQRLVDHRVLGGGID